MIWLDILLRLYLPLLLPLTLNLESQITKIDAKSKSATMAAGAYDNDDFEDFMEKVNSVGALHSSVV